MTTTAQHCRFRRIFGLAALVATAIWPTQTGSAADDNPAPERVALWSGQAPDGDGNPVSDDAFITVHRPDEPNGTAVIICPGGGYRSLVLDPEGHGIARWLNAQGIVGIVLEYRLPNGNPRVPLLDAQRAIRTVRWRAEQWEIDPRRVGIMGFSAGGHLASTAATHFDAGDASSERDLERLGCRPDFAVLVYPVITMDESSHVGSKANLLGENPDAESLAWFSTEKQVSAQSPPTFLAHALDDKVVPAENSRRFFDALRAHGVDAEFLELPSGGHGLDGYQGEMWDAWQSACLQWMAAQGF
ncbi:hypothetical protein BH23VER1_BH23VER1_16190 [soil metagenome]